jgi:hypothetical protein
MFHPSGIGNRRINKRATTMVRILRQHGSKLKQMTGREIFYSLPYVLYRKCTDLKVGNSWTLKLKIQNDCSCSLMKNQRSVYGDNTPHFG